MLNHNQHGYRWKHSTSTAILEVIDALEKDCHPDKPTPTLYGTSWDIRKAFDSISTNMMRLAWTRLGVPAPVTTWLTSLDRDGLTFVMTPYMMEKLRHRPLDKIMETDGHILPDEILTLGFHSIRGITQGDTASTVAWIALYDILLTLIDDDPITRPSGEREDVNVTTVYADDLFDLQSSLTIAQRKATLISAFCAYSGMEIATGKLVTFKRSDEPLVGESLTVYSLVGWTPTVIPMTQNRTIPYLGTTTELYPLNRKKDSFDDVVKYVNMAGMALIHRRASKDCKAEVLAQQITPKALYKSIMSSWTLEQYKRLDVIFTRMWKAVLRLPENSPTALIHLPHEYSGMGIPKFSDAANQQKWNSLQRNIAVGGSSAISANASIERAIALRGQGTYFVTSILDWAEECGFELSRRETWSPDSLPSRDYRELVKLVKERELRVVYTDGSVSLDRPTPSDILQTSYDLRDRVSAGSALLFTDSETPEENVYSQPIAVYIDYEHSAHINKITPYTAEILPALLARKIGTELDYPVAHFTDCLNVARGFGATLEDKHAGHRAHTIMYEAAASMAGLSSVATDWIRSHPEKRKKRKDWTQDDWGIYLADAITEKNNSRVFERYKGQYTPMVIHIDDIWNLLIPPPLWRWTDTDGSIHLDSLLTARHIRDLETYLKNRDGYRAQRGLPAEWETTAKTLSHQLTQPSKPSQNPENLETHDSSDSEWGYWKHYKYGARLAATQLVFDKRLSNGRVRQYTVADIEHTEKCSLCIQTDDSLSHLALICDHPNLNDIRLAAKEEQECILRDLEKNHPLGTPFWLRAFFTKLYMACWDTSKIPEDAPSRLWRGLITKDILKKLVGETNVDKPLHKSFFRTFRAGTVRLLRPLIRALRNMIKERSSIYRRNQKAAGHEHKLKPVTLKHGTRRHRTHSQVQNIRTLFRTHIHRQLNNIHNRTHHTHTNHSSNTNTLRPIHNSRINRKTHKISTYIPSSTTLPPEVHISHENNCKQKNPMRRNRLRKRRIAISKLQERTQAPALKTEKREGVKPTTRNRPERDG